MSGDRANSVEDDEDVDVGGGGVREAATMFPEQNEEDSVYLSSVIVVWVADMVGWVGG